MRKHAPYLLLILFFSTPITVFSQNDDYLKMGRVSVKELQMQSYSKDTSAVAVYLNEAGRIYFHEGERGIVLIKKYYAKIKILKKEGLGYGDIIIPYYHNDKSKEKISNIKAITYTKNKSNTTLEKGAVFDLNKSENWSEKRFSFANVQVGSVIEYSYELRTPFLFNLEGWKFQTDIPKIKSEFRAQIPGNYRYNRTLMGVLKLNVDKSSLKKRCFKLNSLGLSADCEDLQYQMRDIPAFKEEKYMLSKQNYMSSIHFQLSEYIRFDGRGSQKFTKTWKSVGNDFKKEAGIGRQLKEHKFFLDKLPKEILSENNSLKKAKAIFYFIQNHFNWNESSIVFRNSRVKKAFLTKTGNAAEINLSLINALKAVGLKVQLMLLSTRDRKLPSKLHPDISGFNYLIAKLDLNDKTYLLDATDKQTPFGILPLKCLNVYGRVMDFKNPSRWFSLKPNNLNIRQVNIKIKIDENHKMVADITETHVGYNSYLKRKDWKDTDRDVFINRKEHLEFFVEDFIIENEADLEKPFIEKYKLISEDELVENSISFPVFLKQYFSENPFKLETRAYPVNFYYPEKFIYQIDFTIPNGYDVEKLPSNRLLKLPDGSTFAKLSIQQTSNKVNMNFIVNLEQTIFSIKQYKVIKNIFKHITNIQNVSRIQLTKVK